MATHVAFLSILPFLFGTHMESQYERIMVPQPPGNDCFRSWNNLTTSCTAWITACYRRYHLVVNVAMLLNRPGVWVKKTALWQDLLC